MQKRVAVIHQRLSPDPSRWVERIDAAPVVEAKALVTELHEKAAYMRKGLTDIGFDLGDSNTHIMPVMIRDETKAMFTHMALFENGVLMVPIMYPAVKQGEERLLDSLADPKSLSTWQQTPCPPGRQHPL